MNKTQFERLKRIGAVVAEQGRIVLDPRATSLDIEAAFAEVDLLGSKGASAAIRNYGNTIGQDPLGSPGQARLVALAAATKEEQALQDRMSAMRSFLKGGGDE